MNLIKVDRANGALLHMLTGRDHDELATSGISTVGARPEHLELIPGCSANVQLVERLGAESLVHLNMTDMSDAVTVLTTDRQVAFGQGRSLRIAAERLHFFDAAGQRLAPC
jgi:multiple sugar transport system ATP-binding protein